MKGEIAQLSIKETLTENETEEVATLHDMINDYEEVKTDNDTPAPKGE
ncbi:MAG: hypothetical protein HZT40_04055 [Candidatus Thiothrix singaporensis]|uniref:Uncharacterized protein n=1 Tax=Candidatus Thiothrix singaporensis TaxID=2799669 RepID=A0A7L6AP83_9GAMM|nr:MAG: hypothetical protein HZT40_04055 [Candidatus Thiothrix singaporensis]